MKKSLKVLLLLGCIALTACAPSNHLFVTTKAINLGQELGPEMVGRNLIATVAYDETYLGNYRLHVRSSAFLQGISDETPEYRLRIAHVNLRLLKGGLWISDGQQGFSTTTVVPDHIEKLKAWDLVEYRSTGTYRTAEHFTTKQDGNIVVRVLCRRADPGYEKCRDALPQLRKYPQGDTGTPYPVSVKEYGYTFTPAYDAKGQPTRVIPEYVPAKL